MFRISGDQAIQRIFTHADLAQNIAKRQHRPASRRLQALISVKRYLASYPITSKNINFTDSEMLRIDTLVLFEDPLPLARMNPGTTSENLRGLITGIYRQLNKVQLTNKM